MTIKHSSVVGERKLCPVPPKPLAKNSHVCVYTSVPLPAEAACSDFCGGRKTLALVMDDMVTAGSLEWVLVGKREKERSVRREKMKYNPKKE